MSPPDQATPYEPTHTHTWLLTRLTQTFVHHPAREALDKRRAFVRKWRRKCRSDDDSLEEAGDRLFTFLRYPPSQWKSLRTTNAIERLHEEFKRRIKTQCVPPSAETACMVFWALLVSGQITLRRVDGWDALRVEPDREPLDLAA